MQLSVNPPLPILRMGLSWYHITQEGRRLTLGVRRLCVQGCWAELRVVKSQFCYLSNCDGNIRLL